MSSVTPVRKEMETPRHRTAWLEAGPPDGDLMIFLHGWPELGLVWRDQLTYFAAHGRRCVAPDMRGYGASSVPDSTAAYAVPELVADMVELHAALGGKPAIWIGHDWGSAVAWAMASHHADRCRAVISLCIPYFARGMTLANLVSVVDRNVYPSERYPVGQWDYWMFYREHFTQAARDFEADVQATLALLYRTAPNDTAPEPAPTAAIRSNNGWFGETHRAPALPRDESLLSQEDFDALVEAFRSTGFSGADAWYMNDATNLAFAATAPKFGRLTLPALFVHAKRDVVCKTIDSRLAEPMRDDCADLTEITIDCGHEIMLERPHELNEAIANWISARRVWSPPGAASDQGRPSNVILNEG